MIRAFIIVLLMSLSTYACGSSGQPAGVNEFGDSDTEGLGVSPTTLGFAYLIQPLFGGSALVEGHGGITTAGLISSYIYNETNTTSMTPPTTIEVGAADDDAGGSSPTRDIIFNRETLAMLSWLALPRTNRLWGQDAGCVKAGTWFNDTTLPVAQAQHIGVDSTTNGSTLTCTLTVGASGVAYVNYLAKDSNGGTMSVTIDGQTPGNDSTLTATGPGGAPLDIAYDSVTTVPFLARYTGLSAGSHVFVFTVTSSTSASNVNGIVWLGTPATVTNATPHVYEGGIPYRQGNSGDAGMAQYNADIIANVATLSGDGLPVSFADIRAFMNDSNDFAGGSVIAPLIPGVGTCVVSNDLPDHPGTCGHDHMAMAYAAAFNSGCSNSVGGATLSGAVIP